MSRSKRYQRFLFEPSRFKHDPAVMAMCPAARGLYAILFCSAWDMPEPGVLPADPAILAPLAMATTEEWACHGPAIAKAFDIESRPGWWVSRGLVETHRVQTRTTKLRSAAGKRGAESLHGKEIDGRAMTTAHNGVEATLGGAGSGTGSGTGSGVSKSTHSVSLADLLAGDHAVKVNSADISNGEEALASWLTGFDEWWETYPRKVAREAARKAYAKIRPRTDLTYTALFTGVEHHKRTEWEGREPDKIPHASTWLNQRRWTDAAQSF